MNLLTLDFGNTHPHAALFRHGKMVESGVLEDVTAWASKHSLTFGEIQGVLSQVKSYDDQLTLLEHRGLLVDRIKTYWRGERFTGLKVNYAATLGEDRLVRAYWAWKNLPGPSLVISAGTYFTIDVIDGGFEGGYILPGLQLLGESLGKGEQLTATQFDHISKDLLTGQELPHATADALTGGAVAYAALIQRLLVRYSPQQIVISGGNTSQVENWLKAFSPSIPLHARADLLHYALLDWYQRNIVA